MAWSGGNEEMNVGKTKGGETAVLCAALTGKKMLKRMFMITCKTAFLIPILRNLEATAKG